MIDDERGAKAPRYGFTQPLCEHCWWERPEANTRWERVRSPKRINSTDRKPVSKKVPIIGRQPIRILDTQDNPRQQATCCECGYPTWSGIFTRVDPSTVPFPTPKEDV